MKLHFTENYIILFFVIFINLFYITNSSYKIFEYEFSTIKSRNKLDLLDILKKEDDAKLFFSNNKNLAIIKKLRAFDNDNAKYNFSKIIQIPSLNTLDILRLLKKTLNSLDFENKNDLDNIFNNLNISFLNNNCMSNEIYIAHCDNIKISFFASSLSADSILKIRLNFSNAFINEFEKYKYGLYDRAVENLSTPAKNSWLKTDDMLRKYFKNNLVTILENYLKERRASIFLRLHNFSILRPSN